jgi:hypothetical protein
MEISSGTGSGSTLDGETVRGWDRIAGTVGVFVVLLFLARLLTPQDISDTTEDNRLGHEVSIFLADAGVGFFLIFLAGVWSRLRRSEGGGGMYAGLFVVGGAAFAAVFLLSAGFDLAVLTADEADVEAALLPLPNWAGLSAVPAAVAMCLGAATAIVTSQAFPTWLGLLTVALGFVFLLGAFRVFGEEGGGALDSVGLVSYLLVNAWVLAASVLLLLRPGDGRNDPR